MKFGILLGIVMMTAGFTGSAEAFSPPEVSVKASVMSSYLWRGIALNKDPVFQPSATIGFGGASLTVWGNMDLTDYQDRQFSVTETDYTLDYTLELPFLSLNTGVLRYQYPYESGSSTTEIFVGAEYGIPGSPSLTIYRDVDTVNGTYIEAGAGQSIAIAPFASLDLSVTLGWGSAHHNRFYYDIPGMGRALTSFSLGAGLPIGLGETFSVIPGVQWVSCLNSTMRKVYDRNLVAFGLTAAAEF